MSPSILGLAALQKVKFLLNSRTPLVIAPCSCTLKSTNAGTPYTKDTGPICRFPSIGLTLHTLGFSPRGTCAGSWYEHPFLPYSFFTGSRTQLNDQKATIPHLICLSSLRYSADLSGLTQTTVCVSLSQSVRSRAIVAEETNGKGILTLFPFPEFLLGFRLGSTNP